VPTLVARYVKEGEIVLPEGMDGLAVFPKSTKVTMKKILAAMKKLREDFVDYSEGRVDERYLRMTEKTAKMLREIEDATPGDVIVLAVQTGLRHRGKSVRKVRTNLDGKEFGLTAEMVGVILLTHPERLQKYEDLAIDCAGSEYRSAGRQCVLLQPYWNLDVGELRFSYRGIDGPDSGFGSGSAVSPE
jgi:hypothetical protein